MDTGEWQAFLADHPELPGHTCPRMDRVDALEHALSTFCFVTGDDARGPIGAVPTRSIAAVICPFPTPRLVGKVGHELGRMADEGLIVRLRPRYRRERLMWTLR